MSDPSTSGPTDPQQPPSYGGAQPPAYPPGQEPAGQGYGQPPGPGYGQAPEYGQGQPPYAGPGGAYPPARMRPEEEKTWATAAHWSGLALGFVTSGVFAFGGPLLVMLLKGNESPRVRANAVEALNFQITYLIAAVVSFILLFLLVGFLLLPIVAIAWLALSIIATVKTNNGEDYRYPLILRLVS